MQGVPRHSALLLPLACRIGLVALLVGVSPPARADGDTERPVRIEPVGAGAAEASPGEIISAAFLLTNPSPERRAVRMNVELPAGWSLLFQAPVTALKPNERVTRLLSFRVPSQTAPGRYEVRLRVTSDEEAFQPGEGAMTVHVRATRAVEITALGAPSVMPAGGAYDTRFFVTNGGNTRVHLRLEARAQGDALEMDEPSIVLDAGASQIVTVRAEIPSEGRSRRHRVHLVAFVGDEEVAEVGVSTEVMPSGRRPESGGGYPVEATLLLGGERGGIGPQLQIVSGLPKDPELARVDFLLRTPSAQPSSSYVMRDEYRVRYASERLGLRFGDNVYALSALTESGRYGFGGGAEYRTPSRTVGAYYQQSRLPGVDEAQAGLHVEQAVAEGSHVGLNLLSAGGFRGGDVASVEGRYVPYVNAEVEAEVGVSTGRGRAVALRFGGGDPRFRYETRFVRSTPEYVGTLRGTALHSVAASGQPLGWLQVEGAWRDQRRQYRAFDGAASSERGEAYGQLGARLLGRLFDRHTSLFVSAHRRKLDVRSPSQRTEQMERGLQVRAGFDPHRLLTLRGGFEAGQTRLSEQHEARPYYRLSAQTRVNVEAYVASLGVEHVRGVEIYTAREQRRWQLSTHIGARVGRTRIGSEVYFNLDQSRGDSRFVVAQFRADHEFEIGHRLSIYSRFSEAGSRSGIVPQYAFSYTVPLGLPIGRASRRAPIVGEVFDAATRAPVEGALLYLGDAVAVTDARGAFELPAPEPGTHYLRVDPASIRFDRTTVHEMPMAIDVGEEGGGIPLLIPVVESGSIEGQVVARTPERAASDSVSEVQLANMVLEASDGNGRYRTITDREGRFLFTDLRPGPWRVRVVHAQLPERHYVEREEVEVLVVSGRRSTAVFEVRERQRTIDVIRSGVLRAN
ncbi:MAG: NEW3 domain-containing protein [Rhodothermales bacterium]